MSLGFQSSSFSEYLAVQAPQLLPSNRTFSAPTFIGSTVDKENLLSPHGTTIVAISYQGGVLIAGDRRATMGNIIASHDIRKVAITDDYSAAGIAGTAGIATEMIRLFAVELEHYEKIEGISLTFDGKANRMATMVRSNLGAAMQGLMALPLFVGFTPSANAQPFGRIVSFDVVGGRYEEHRGFYSIGSGSMFAKTVLKKSYDSAITAEDALRLAMEALSVAAEEDSATGGPDLIRQIFPTAIAIDVSGAKEVDVEVVREVVLGLHKPKVETKKKPMKRIAK